MRGFIRIYFTNNEIFWNILAEIKFGDHFSKQLQSRNWDPSNLNADEAWNQWKYHVLSTAEECFGYRPKNKKHKPWFDIEIESLILERKKACQAHRYYSKCKKICVIYYGTITNANVKNVNY